MFVTSNKAMALKRAVLAVVLCAAAMLVLAGCGSVLEPADIPETPKPTVAVSAPVEKPVPVQETKEPAALNSSVDSAVYGNEDEDPADDAADEMPAAPAVNSIEAIAAVGNTMEYEDNRYDTVHMDTAHNPYDVVWDYGDDYADYIALVDDAGMWDVLFDVDFYTETFPMLAMLYRYDAGLLLEHFQTVGIHEGRQGSAAFNVEAYMSHCDGSLIDAFGDNYECYYLYWALNQDTESDIDVSGDGHALQLCAELTLTQFMELRKVNEYRAEVGADPVIFDSEIAAFACYRATVDMLDGYDGHAWMADHIAECDKFLDAIHSGKYTENTVHSTSRSREIAPRGWYLNYYNSESHYSAMVDPNQVYFGCSNLYVFRGDGDITRGAQFDIYPVAASTPLNP